MPSVGVTRGARSCRARGRARLLPASLLLSPSAPAGMLQALNAPVPNSPEVFINFCNWNLVLVFPPGEVILAIGQEALTDEEFVQTRLRGLM